MLNSGSMVIIINDTGSLWNAFLKYLINHSNTVMAQKLLFIRDRNLNNLICSKSLNENGCISWVEMLRDWIRLRCD